MGCRPRADSIDRSLLAFPLCREPEALVNHAVTVDEPRNVLAQRRTMLEAVAGAAADDPDVLELGMPVDQEVAVAAVLVLADLRGHERRVAERREAPSQVGAHRIERLAGDAIARVGIEGRTVTVECDLEAARRDVRDAVHLLAEVDPRRHRRRREPRVACRRAEVEHLLARREDPIAQKIWEQCWEPRTTREDERRAADPL